MRLTNLTAKPPWTDEFATLVFTLGNNYNSIPRDQIISLDRLLQLLQPNFHAKVSDVVSLLLTQDNHPPLYFVLAHLWLKLFPSSDLNSLLWYSRLLPVLFSVITIPCIYFLVKKIWGNPLSTNLSAMLMAFSPYAIFLSQEARQYSLGILLVTLSLGCMLLAIKEINTKRNFSWGLVFGWIAINSIGLLVHYFFILTLIGQVIALALYYFKYGFSLATLKKIFLVILSTAIFGMTWFLYATSLRHGEHMTSWIRRDNSDLFALFKPFFQIFATWLTMIYLLPVESTFLVIVLFSGLLMLLFFIWIFPILYRGIKNANKLNIPTLKILIGFIGGVIFLFALLTYCFGIDITRGARYSFVYFPAVVILIAIALTYSQTTKKNLLLISLVAFLSALTVVFNLGYEKYYRPDLLLPIIESNSTPSRTRIIATPYQSLVQIGEMISIAWVLKEENILLDSNFLFVDKIPPQQSLKGISSDYDLLLMNFEKPLPNLPNCQVNSERFPVINGYSFVAFHCLYKY